MNAVIKEKVDLIANCVFLKAQEASANYGVYNGEFGRLLFLLYYSRFSEKEEHILLADCYAERLMQQFVEKEKMHSFCSGLSGILYMFEFLREHQIINLDASSVQRFLEDYMVSKMREDFRRNHFDFMHGALGVGLYFLKRKSNPEIIHELIEFLYHTAEKDEKNNHFKWVCMVNQEKKLYAYNLALSHGISGIIIFLSRVIQSGMMNEKIRELITGSVNFVLSQEKIFSQFGSFFPSYVPIKPQEPALKSRIAWCYGDLGVGMALWQAGKAMKKSEWEEKGLEILLRSTERRILNDTFVSDAEICHGSAGVAMIFRRMFIETKREAFNDAVSYWINQSLNFSTFKDGLAGYKTREKDGWRNDYSLLSGISGIGLVLVSYLENDNQDWDELFLMS